jgi:hypothetical protein
MWNEEKKYWKTDWKVKQTSKVFGSRLILKDIINN